MEIAWIKAFFNRKKAVENWFGNFVIGNFPSFNTKKDIQYKKDILYKKDI